MHIVHMHIRNRSTCKCTFMNVQINKKTRDIQGEHNDTENE